MANVHWVDAVSGNFDLAAGWAGDAVPTPADTAILDAKGGAFTVTSTADQSVAGVQTIAGATLAITGETTFTIGHGTKGGANAGTIAVSGAILGLGGTFNNTGVVSLSSATMILGGTGATFEGGGRIVLSDAGGSAIECDDGGVLTNVDNTVSGAGQIGGGKVINRKAATIDANAGHTLTIGGAGTSVVNAGTIKETGAGRLSFTDETITNSGAVVAMGTGVLTLYGAKLANVPGGKLTAAAGSHISFQRDAVVTGGVLSVADGATLSIDSGYGNAIGVASLVNLGAIKVSDLASVTMAGSIDNQGLIQLDSAGHVTTLDIGDKGVTLGGGGQVTLTDNRLNYVGGSGSLTNLNNEISGAGNLGLGELALFNRKNGSILATGDKAALTIDTGLAYADQNEGVITTTGAAGLVITATSMTNTGTLNAQGSGALVVRGATISSAGGGKVTATAGAHISLTGGGVLVGGALTVEAGATLTADSAYGNLIAAASFSNQGVTAIGAGDGLTLSGSIANKGELKLNSAGQATHLIIATGVTLGGAGAVVLSDNKSNYLIGGPNGGTLTNVNDTISGAGRIGGYALSLDNRAGGVIDANGASAALTLEITGSSLAVTNEGMIKTTQAGGLVIDYTGLTNTGTVLAEGAGVLTLEDASIANGAGGVVAVRSGARISLQEGVIAGGSVSIADGAKLTADSAYDNSIAATSFANAGAVVIGDDDGLTLAGAIANSGTISLNGADHETDLLIATAGVTLSGGGTVTLSSSIHNFVSGVTADSKLTNVDNRITGGGQLGDGLLTLVNQAGGVILGNTAVTLTIDTGAVSIVNAGTIVAAGGTVIVASNIENDGKLIARTGGLLTLQKNVTGSGEIDVFGGTVDSAGLLLEGVDFAAGGVLIIENSKAFLGDVSGFSTAGKTSLDLRDIAFAQGQTQCAFVDNGKRTGGNLTITSGSQTVVIRMVGDFVGTTFTATSDGHGGSTVVDKASPRASPQGFSAAMASVGAPGHAMVGALTEGPAPRLQLVFAASRLAGGHGLRA